MRELTAYEIDQTGGGILPVLVALVGSYVGQLMVEAMGGAEGIEKGVKDVYDFFTKGVEGYQEFCKNHPEANC